MEKIKKKLLKDLVTQYEHMCLLWSLGHVSNKKHNISIVGGKTQPKKIYVFLYFS